MDLPKELAGWTDSDGAAYDVGRALGIFAEHEGFTSLKWVFWSDNPVGRALHEILLQLVAHAAFWSRTRTRTGSGGPAT